MSTRLVLAFVCVLALLSFVSPASADLGKDVSQLSKRWAESTRVRRLKPQLLERGTIRPLLLSRAETDPTTESCTTVAVLGANSTSLIMRFLPTEGPLRWPEGEFPEASIAGAVQLVRCGVRKAMLDRLALEMRSPRGVVEILVAQGPRPLPPLLRTLAHRDPGPAAPLGRSGPRPISAPLRDRADALERRARREGARDVGSRLVSAERDGSGEIPLRLDAGCYRLDVLGVPTPEGWPRGVDLDAELAFVPEGTLAAQDRTESADASLSFCVGARKLARLRFAGTIPSSPVVALIARWDLPTGLPASWGPGARAQIAEAVRRHHLRDLGGSPVYSSIGVAGVTVLPLEVEPGACYLAAIAPIRGEPLGIALAAQADTQRAEDNPGASSSGTAVAFCAGQAERALIDVEARGIGLVWLLGVWQTGRMPIGEVAE
jgi:hypothetical protein